MRWDRIVFRKELGRNTRDLHRGDPDVLIPSLVQSVQALRSPHIYDRLADIAIRSIS